jgi:hypothetical protein
LVSNGRAALPQSKEGRRDVAGCAWAKEQRDGTQLANAAVPEGREALETRYGWDGEMEKTSRESERQRGVKMGEKRDGGEIYGRW